MKKYKAETPRSLPRGDSFYDVVIIGAGAAGLTAARGALVRGKKVLILDMGDKPLRKVLASGGGRCNFTNLAADHSKYFGKNPEFARSALTRVKPADILDWAKSHGIKYIEKNPGQYFCKDGAEVFVSAMLKDVRGADIILNAEVVDVEKKDEVFYVRSKKEDVRSSEVIVATGGVSFPTLGVSEIGYKIAKKFGHKIEPIKPGLVALKTDAFPAELSGVALPVEISAEIPRSSRGMTVRDSLLFTHFGIGGPAVYRASMLDLSAGLKIDFMPGESALEFLKRAKKHDGKKMAATVLSERLPVKFARWLCSSHNGNVQWIPSFDGVTRRDGVTVGDMNNAGLEALAKRINNFIVPNVKVRGFQSAEVTLGGVSTDEISSKTFESKLCPGLYFIGEVLDITGDLGGFNLHFAFASGIVAGGGQKI